MCVCVCIFVCACLCMTYVCVFLTFHILLCHPSSYIPLALVLQERERERERERVCVCVCVFIKLRITAQSGPVILGWVGANHGKSGQNKKNAAGFVPGFLDEGGQAVEMGCRRAAPFRH